MAFIFAVRPIPRGWSLTVLAMECGASAPPWTGRLDGVLIDAMSMIAFVGEADSRGCPSESGAKSPQSRMRLLGEPILSLPARSWADPEDLCLLEQSESLADLGLQPVSLLC